MLAGYYRGWVDTFFSRMIDVVLSIPSLLLGLGIAAACSVQAAAPAARSSRGSAP